MSTDTGFLADDAPRLWTIPAGVPFLRALARQLASDVDLANHPDALQDALVYVPNRRSARTLAFELLHAAGEGATLLPPDIRALGDMESDSAPHGAEEALAGLGPLLSEARRTGTLMRLVMAYFDRTGEAIPLPGALAAAHALGTLLDQAALGGVEDWSALETLVADQPLARHWERSTAFLGIIAQEWPKWLDEQGALDPMTRRVKSAQALANHWRETPPAGPLIIAGSTGSTPSSLALMEAAMALPQGRVVLPGLDTASDPSDWAEIAKQPSHPQSALWATLGALGVAIEDVAEWAVESGDQPLRRRLIHQALAPANLTGDWQDRIEAFPSGPDATGGIEAALDGFTLIEASDEAHEAQLAALLMRADLEQAGGMTALVTPDAQLARRVSALLARWSVDVVPSAGTPLFRTPQGLALQQILTWWLDPGDPVHMAGLIKSGRVDCPPEQARVLEETVLRGPKRWSSLAGLARRCGEAGPARALVDLLGTALAATEGAERRSGLTWSSDLAKLVQALGATETLWCGQAGQAAARLIDETASLLEAFPDHPLEDFVQMVLARAEGVVVPPGAAGHPRLAIWGPLEARLQAADHFILASLNEDVWPRRPSADPFLPAHFKRALGLPDPEERLGLMAHDFAGLACSPKVTCLYSDRREDAPAVASRWIWRLKTLVRGAGAEHAFAPAPSADPRPLANAMWHVPSALKTPDGFAEPRPKPPPGLRPSQLSVTRIDWLQRDPYAIYAEAILGIRPLAPLAQPVGPAERGTAIHSALEQVGLQAIPAEPHALAREIEDRLRDAGTDDASLLADRAVTYRTAEWCLDWLAERGVKAADVKTEIKGRLAVEIAGEPFTLTAKADRIEVREGGLAILDFKTGSPPSQSQIDTGLSQQMPLQALIAAGDGFEGIAGRRVDELVYVAFKAKPEIRAIGGDPAELADAARDGLVRLVTAYRNPDQAYLSGLRMQTVGYDYGYNRLARRAEWAAETSDD